MKFIEKHPIIMIIIGVIGISLSSIFVRYSAAPSSVTAMYRLLWTVVLMTPVVLFKKDVRRELFSAGVRTWLLSALSGVFLAIHFVLWFESLNHTSVASSTTIVCTEVIWVIIGFCIFMKGRLSGKAIFAVAVTIIGSAVIAFADGSAGEAHLYGDILSLVAAIAVGIYTLIGRAVRKNTSTSVYTYIVYLSCAAVLTVTSLIGGHRFVADFEISALIVGLLLAVFSTILGHSIFSWCLKFFSPAFISTSKLCEPVVAAVFAIFLFGEVPSLLQIFGALLILGGVFYYSMLASKEKN